MLNIEGISLGRLVWLHGLVLYMQLLVYVY